MKLSWILTLMLLALVALFSVQNAAPIAIRFLGWETSISAALVIQLAALLGGFVGLVVGARSRPARPPSPPPPASGDGAEGSVAGPEGHSDRAGATPEDSPGKPAHRFAESIPR